MIVIISRFAHLLATTCVLTLNQCKLFKVFNGAKIDVFSFTTNIFLFFFLCSRYQSFDFSTFLFLASDVFFEIPKNYSFKTDLVGTAPYGGVSKI